MIGPPLAHLGAGPLEPLQSGFALAAVAAYALRARALRRRGRPVARARQAAFYGGVALTVATLLSPLGHLAGELLLAHMTEHLLIADVGALLIVLGLTGPILAPLLRVGAIDRLRVLSHPLIALPLWTIDLYLWHLPTLYEAALRDPALHALEHTAFIACGVNMWMCLLGPLPTPRWFANLHRLVYVVAVRLIGAVLGNVFVWSAKPFYRYYLPGEHYWRVSPAADQSTAGAIMMVEGSILTICLFAWLFLRTAREGQESQDLLDLAAARGVELSPQRAQRAVAAGAGAELRRRVSG